MTVTQAQTELQEANTWVRQAVENALEMKAAATEIPASLERIAHAIESVAMAPIEGDVNVLKPELEVLRTRMRQLQALLDGAAAFYCASIAHTRSQGAECYSATGTSINGSAAYQLQIRI
jgi:hypothetical protein